MIPSRFIYCDSSKIGRLAAALLLALTVSAAAERSAGAEPDATTSATSTNWVQITTPVAPSPRCYSAMTYDRDSGKTILFGGFDGTKYLHDTWSFDGQTWKKLFPPTAPTARTAAQMAYDANAHRVVLFGGYDGTNHLGDTWLWDGATSTWQKATPKHSPTKATSPMLFTDPLNGSVDKIGGYDGRYYQYTMWQWTGSDWKELNPETMPTARSSASVGVNLKTKRVVMFGGLADINPVNTWVYDGTTWTQQNPTTQLPWVYGGVGVYQPNALHGKVLIFGGASAGQAQDTTWRWLGSTWKHVQTATKPLAREGAGVAFDEASGNSVIFGGQNGPALLNDTWKLTP